MHSFRKIKCWLQDLKFEEVLGCLVAHTRSSPCRCTRTLRLPRLDCPLYVLRNHKNNHRAYVLRGGGQSGQGTLGAWSTQRIMGTVMILLYLMYTPMASIQNIQSVRPTRDKPFLLVFTPKRVQIKQTPWWLAAPGNQSIIQSSRHNVL